MQCPRFRQMSRLGSMATSDGVYTQHLPFEQLDVKDQRKTQTQTLGVIEP